MDYVHGRMGKMTCVFSLPPPPPRSNVLEWRLWFCFFGLFGSGLFFGLFGSGFLVAGAIVLRLYFICLC